MNKHDIKKEAIASRMQIAICVLIAAGAGAGAAAAVLKVFRLFEPVFKAAFQ